MQQESAFVFSNPVIVGNQGDDHGDPFILRYLDRYYLYHTGNTAGRKGISVYESSDLATWEFRGFALEVADGRWAATELWAPEVLYRDGVFYMYVSGTVERSGKGDDSVRRNGVAKAASPLGPFVLNDEPLDDRWMIDASPFRDKDGSHWLFYNTRDQDTAYRDGTIGTGIYCRRLGEFDALAGDTHEVAIPSERWEGNLAGDFYWNEGPFVVQRHGRYYVMYSGGAFTEPTYGVGFTAADRIGGPWRKYDRNPFWGSKGKVFGPGHHALILGPDGATSYVVYHGYVLYEPETEAGYRKDKAADDLHWTEGRKVLIDRFYWVGDRPMVGGPTTDPQPLPGKPVHHPDSPYWRAEVWVKGTYLDVDGYRVVLPTDKSYVQIHLTSDPDRCSVVEYGFEFDVAPGGGVPHLTTDGEIGAQTVTTYREDEAFHNLAAGDEVAWEWNINGPSELVLAVKGSAVISAGDTEEQVLDSDGQFQLVTLQLPARTGRVVVGAQSDAVVTDLFLFAR